MLTSVSVYHVETHYIYTQPRGVIPVPHDVTMLTSVSVYHVETHYIYTQPRGVIPVPHDVTIIRPIP